jgi:zinc protease
VACIRAWSSPARAAEFASPPIERYALWNGLDVVLEQNRREPQVAIVVSYDVGWRDDPPGYAGLAHLVEHLTRRGSRHLKANQGVELLERAGAVAMSEQTQLDRTLYSAVVPSGALELALWVESERMAFTLEAFDENALELGRHVIETELRLGESAASRFDGHVMQALYGQEHPYVRGLREREELERIGLSAAQWFFQASYRPERAHLVIVGNFEPAAAKVLVQRYFGAVENPKTPPLARPPLKPPAVASRRVRFEAVGDTNELVAVFPAPAPGSREHVAAELLATALGPLLRGELVEQARLATSVQCVLVDREAGSELWIKLRPRAKVTRVELERALEAELARVLGGAREMDFDEWKLALRQREIEALEDPLARARAHVESIAARGAPLDSAQRLAALRAVTERDVAALGAELLRDPRVIGELDQVAPNRALGPEGRVTFTP